MEPIEKIKIKKRRERGERGKTEPILLKSRRIFKFFRLFSPKLSDFDVISRTLCRAFVYLSL